MLFLSSPLNRPRVVLTAILLVCVAACAPYRIDVQQGNYLTQKEISKLHAGMSKREVRYILGTPLIVDPFHKNRWEYYYSFRSGNKSEVLQRLVTIVFADDRVQSIEADTDLPSAAAASTGGTKIVETSAKSKKKKKGIFRRTIDKIKGTDSAKDEY